MSSSDSRLNASEAARRLGITIKALRLYEQRGLVKPGRTAAGYRTYAPADLARAAEIVALRTLGLSLTQVARVLDGEPESLQAALSAHEAALNQDLQTLAHRIDRLRALQADLAQGHMPTKEGLGGLLDRSTVMSAAFELPWPWGGEWFEVRDVRPLNYIIGPLGSGKTRLARRLAETLPNASFIGLNRLDNECAVAKRTLECDSALQLHVTQTVMWLMDEGATQSDALTALLVALAIAGPAALVIDMIEQDLDQPSQEALMVHLRQRASLGGQPLFLITRSSAILDIALVGPNEAIVLCPANHNPPIRVVPVPGAPEYEAVATCLATPAVRERIARRPPTAGSRAKARMIWRRKLPLLFDWFHRVDESRSRQSGVALDPFLH